MQRGAINRRTLKLLVGDFSSDFVSLLVVLPFRARPSRGVTQPQLDLVRSAYESYSSDQRFSERIFRNVIDTALHLIAELTITKSDVADIGICCVDGFLGHDCACPTEFGRQQRLPQS